MLCVCTLLPRKLKIEHHLEKNRSWNVSVLEEPRKILSTYENDCRFVDVLPRSKRVNTHNTIQYTL